MGHRRDKVVGVLCVFRAPLHNANCLFGAMLLQKELFHDVSSHTRFGILLLEYTSSPFKSSIIDSLIELKKKTCVTYLGSVIGSHS
jgi:hypothetical protein